MDVTSNSHMLIQPATDSDWSWIEVVHAQTDIESFSYDHLDDNAVTRCRERVAQQIANLRGPDAPPHAVLVARDADNSRAGVIWVEEMRHQFTGKSMAYVTLRYVEPGYRGQGIGRELLTAAEQWARDRDLDALELNVAMHNDAACALYASADFQPVQQRMRKCWDRG